MACALVVTLACAPHAAEAAPTARLVYSRSTEAATCPDELALRRAVAARIGYDVFFPWAPRTVVVAIVRRQESFVATVSLVDEAGIDHGAHELHTGAACVDLLDTVALAVAIAIDPTSSLAAPAATLRDPLPPPSPPDPPAMPEPVALSPKPEAPSAALYALPTTHLETSFGALASFGMAPSPAVGTSLGVDVRWRYASLGVEAAIDAPSGTAVGAATASAWVTYGAIVPCAYYGMLFGCAELQLGAMESFGGGVTDTHSQTTRWLAAGGRAGALLPLTSVLSLRPRADLVGILAPTELLLDGARAWKTSAVAGALGIDVVVRFR